AVSGECSNRAVEVPVLPSRIPLQFTLGPLLVLEARARHRRKIDRRLALDDPGRECLSQRRCDRKPGNIAAACEVEAFDPGAWAEKVVTVGGHRRDPATKFAHASRLQD